MTPHRVLRRLRMFVVLTFVWVAPLVVGRGAAALDFVYMPFPGGLVCNVWTIPGTGSHTVQPTLYAYDFGPASCGEGGQVVASRYGTVLRAVFDQPPQPNPCLYDNWPLANYVVINHGTGESTLYLHLQQNSGRVVIGQSVGYGDWIANSDNTGYSCNSHIHFQVEVTPGATDSFLTNSIPVCFADGPQCPLVQFSNVTSGNYPPPPCTVPPCPFTPGSLP